MARGKKGTPPKPRYTFRAGARVSGASAQTAGEELDRIRAARGELTTRAVVDESKPDDAPLHPCFEWNNAKAADEYRQQQARNLIRAVAVMVEGNPEPVQVYAHVSATPDAPNRYEPLSVIVERPDFFALALSELRVKLEGSLRAVTDLRQAAEQKGTAAGLQMARTVEAAIRQALGAVRES